MVGKASDCPDFYFYFIFSRSIDLGLCLGLCFVNMWSLIQLEARKFQH